LPHFSIQFAVSVLAGIYLYEMRIVIIVINIFKNKFAGKKKVCIFAVPFAEGDIKQGSLKIPRSGEMKFFLSIFSMVMIRDAK